MTREQVCKALMVQMFNAALTNNQNEHFMAYLSRQLTRL